MMLRKESLPAMQRTHFFTCLALIPSLLFFAVLNFVLPAFGFYRMWVYNAWTLSVMIPFFLFTFFKYGFFGIRLLIERRKLDSTLRASLVCLSLARQRAIKITDKFGYLDRLL
jgi:hypothetical protein